ncbi:hypothetical protein ABPG72_002350 [Tetrahymena utriculariae]
MRIFIVKLILIFQLSKHVWSQNSNINLVYSPFYLNKIDFLEDQGTPLIIRVAYDIDLVFISLGFKGIQVMDETGNQLLFKSVLGKDYISAFDVTNDGNYIIVGLNSIIKVYQFINPLNQLNLPQQFIQVGQCDFPTQVEDLVYIKSLNIAVAV